MDQRLNESLVTATKEMFESMMGWDIACLPATSRKLNEVFAEANVIISFVGKPSGALALKCSRQFAAKIASGMLGMDVDDDSDDMKDAVGEFLNMIIGRAKTLYSPTEVFKISVPTLVIGDNYVLHIQSAKADTITALDFQYGQESMCLEVILN